MLEYFGEADQRHLAICAGHLNDPPAEGLPEGMCRKIVEVEVVCGLDRFEFSVNCLNSVNAPGPRKETGLRKINNPKGLAAILNMALEPFVDTDFPALAGFVLIYHQLIVRKKLVPPQHGQVRKT